MLIVARKLAAGIECADSCPAVNTLAGTDPSLWVTASYMFSHMYGEFIVDPELLPLPQKTTNRSPLDAGIFQWFLRTLRGVPKLEDEIEGADPDTKESNGAETPRIQREETRPLLVAAAAFALITASVSPLPEARDGSDEAGVAARENLLELQRWFDETLTRWKSTGTLIQWDVARETLTRMAWMMSPDGYMLVERILEDAVDHCRSALTRDLFKRMEVLSIEEKTTEVCPR